MKLLGEPLGPSPSDRLSLPAATDATKPGTWLWATPEAKVPTVVCPRCATAFTISRQTISAAGSVDRSVTCPENYNGTPADRCDARFYALLLNYTARTP